MPGLFTFISIYRSTLSLRRCWALKIDVFDCYEFTFDETFKSGIILLSLEEKLATLYEIITML